MLTVGLVVVDKALAVRQFRQTLSASNADPTKMYYQVVDTAASKAIAPANGVR